MFRRQPRRAPRSVDRQAMLPLRLVVPATRPLLNGEGEVMLAHRGSDD